MQNTLSYWFYILCCIAKHRRLSGWYANAGFIHVSTLRVKAVFSIKWL